MSSPAPAMNGAASLVHTLLKSGIDTCFANPGTSEMHFVGALDQIPGMHCVLGLQENVVTGMADGYYRIARKPACTLLHCGPGLANGMGNLHNARRARSAIVNVVGDQATYHRPHDAPLTADTEGMARTVSHWVRTSVAASEVGRDAAAAVQSACTAPGQIATLILPADSSWNAGGVVAEPLPVPAPAPVDAHTVEAIARVLRGKKNVLILLADDAGFAPSQALAWRVAQATGAHLLVAQQGNAHMHRGRGRLALEKVPYALEAAVKVLAPYEHIVLVNAKPPVGFFAYPGKPSIHYSASAQLHVLSRPDQDPQAALQALVDALGAPPVAIPDVGPRPEPARGATTQENLAVTLAALMPEGAIVSNESVSYGRDFYALTHNAAPHDWLNLGGGAIGDGLPVATGAAVAGGERRVISLQADGSAMYSLQSLWTQAREQLPCTTILLNNRKYNILIGEYKNVGATPGPTAMGMLDLSNPDIDWVKLANSLGVEAARATTMEACADLMQQSFKAKRPFLIDLII